MYPVHITDNTLNITTRNDSGDVNNNDKHFTGSCIHRGGYNNQNNILHKLSILLHIPN